MFIATYKRPGRRGVITETFTAARTAREAFDMALSYMNQNPELIREGYELNGVKEATPAPAGTVKNGG